LKGAKTEEEIVREFPDKEVAVVITNLKDLEKEGFIGSKSKKYFIKS
jgi:hypothetical protein